MKFAGVTSVTMLIIGSTKTHSPLRIYTYFGPVGVCLILVARIRLVPSNLRLSGSSAAGSAPCDPNQLRQSWRIPERNLLSKSFSAAQS